MYKLNVFACWKFLCILLYMNMNGYLNWYGNTYCETCCFWYVNAASYCSVWKMWLHDYNACLHTHWHESINMKKMVFALCKFWFLKKNFWRMISYFEKKRCVFEMTICRQICICLELMICEMENPYKRRLKLILTVTLEHSESTWAHVDGYVFLGGLIDDHNEG